MQVTRCVECNHAELSINSDCLCACHVKGQSFRTPAERIAELEAELHETRETLAVAQSGVLDKQLLADAQAERDAAIVRCRALAESLRGYLLQYPAFRNKPLGSEGSPARIEQEILIEAEDLAKRLIGKEGGGA